MKNSNDKLKTEQKYFNIIKKVEFCSLIVTNIKNYALFQTPSMSIISKHANLILMLEFY